MRDQDQDRLLEQASLENLILFMLNMSNFEILYIQYCINLLNSIDLWPLLRSMKVQDAMRN